VLENQIISGPFYTKIAVVAALASYFSARQGKMHSVLPCPSLIEAAPQVTPHGLNTHSNDRFNKPHRIVFTLLLMIPRHPESDPYGQMD
jgi:hypothetical protein